MKERTSIVVPASGVGNGLENGALNAQLADGWSVDQMCQSMNGAILVILTKGEDDPKAE